MYLHEAAQGLITLEPLEDCMVQGQRSGLGSRTQQNKDIVSRENVVPDESFQTHRLPPVLFRSVKETEGFNYTLSEIKKYNLYLDKPYLNMH